MKRWFFLIALSTMGTWLTACGRAPRAVRIGEDAAGDSIELRVGDTLKVELKADPVKGFVWDLAEVGEMVLKASEPEFVPDMNSIAGGGLYIFSFEAVHSGQTEIVFIYRKAFAMDIPPEKEFKVVAMVK